MVASAMMNAIVDAKTFTGLLPDPSWYEIHYRDRVVTCRVHCIRSNLIEAMQAILGYISSAGQSIPQAHTHAHLPSIGA
jgi:uncharacterized protein (UPF0248 family)